MNPLFPLSPAIDRSPVLTFAPLAWLKLQYFCHFGDTEVGGFAISAPKNLLYIQDFRTVRQHTTSVSVRFEDAAVADFFDECVDRGLKVSQFARIWLHTHPGASAMPSGTDEETFSRVFGGCDWSLMFILSRTGQTYARLAFPAGPGGQMLLPVQVDWPAWPKTMTASDQPLAANVEQWRNEFTTNILAEPWIAPETQAPTMDVPSDEAWNEFMAEWLERYELAEC
ncbi:MAG TPA: hypothetical protein VGZ47_23905 [Gemmataceae bacterium]|nr:hypothetical protein [Gemmataceae bacterium]